MATYIKNNDGLFLRNSSNKLLKQNYVIGRGFRGTAGASGIYGVTKLRGLTLSTTYIIEEVVRTYTLTGNNRGLWLIDNGTYNVCALQFTNSLSIYTPSNYVLLDIANKWHTIVVKSSDIKNYLNGLTSTGTVNLANIPTGAITKLELFPISGGLGLNARGDLAVFEWRLFDRSFDISEIQYNASNGNGNDPTSTLSLKVWYKFEEAEILDFSDALDGSNMLVGFRDYSGNNRHLELKNLPAGTLAEKLAYANANLIVEY